MGWGGEGAHARVLNIEGDMSPRSLLKSTPMHTTDEQEQYSVVALSSCCVVMGQSQN